MMVSGMGVGDVPQRTRRCRLPASWRRTDFRQHPHAGFSVLGAMMSIIACMMVGMPAITMTLPSLKPGARMVALWISSAPSRKFAPMRQPRLVQILLGPAFAEPRHHFGVVVDADAERFRQTLSAGDVVMGRPDAAGW